MPSQEEIDNQLQLLETYRQTMALNLQKRAIFGLAHTPNDVTFGIKEAGEAIFKIKETLQAWNVPVEDLPGDEAEPFPAQSVEISTSEVSAYSRRTCCTLFDEDPLTLCDVHHSVFYRLFTFEIPDCSVDCEMRLFDDGGNPASWAGFRIRGFNIGLDHIGLGYLVYMRSFGTIELFRKTKTIGGEEKRVIENTQGEWTRLRIDAYASNIQVWVNDDLHISKKDRSFGAEGFICLHTFFIGAQFRNMRVYELLPQT